MWRIDIWVDKKWKRTEELETFEEARAAVKEICEKSKVVSRGTLKEPSTGQFCGIVAYPFRGAYWWTAPGIKK